MPDTNSSSEKGKIEPMPSEGYTHPYIPNAAPAARAKMFREIGIDNIDDLYDAIPDDLRLKRMLDLAPPMRSEHELRRHLDAILHKNRHCNDHLSFLGGGCWQHQVPAVCDEIAARGEFLTAYGAWPYSDHGKYQAMFEYQSLLGELVAMEVVSTPTYDAGCAASSACLIACRITGRRKIAVPENLSKDRHSQISGFTGAAAELVTIKCDPATGLLDLADLEARLGDDIAAVYFETPSYLGTIETQAPAIVELAHAKGALAVVCVDPSSLGVLTPPGDYGADMTVGELQPLGIHMNGGGGLAGFIASRDDARIVAEFPTYLISIVPSADGKGFGFDVSTMERTSYDKREDATDYYGTTQWLWGIVAGVYLSLMGPQGMADLGTGIMQRAQYAARRLGAIPGVTAPLLSGPHFKEIVVGFDTMPVTDVNRALLDRGIFGGKPLNDEFPSLGQAALFAFTEVHSQADIDRLVATLEEIVR